MGMINMKTPAHTFCNHFNYNFSLPPFRLSIAGGKKPVHSAIIAFKMPIVRFMLDSMDVFLFPDNQREQISEKLIRPFNRYQFDLHFHIDLTFFCILLIKSVLMTSKNSTDFHFQRTSEKQKLRKGKSDLRHIISISFQLVLFFALKSNFFYSSSSVLCKETKFLISLNGLCGSLQKVFWAS